MDVPKSREAAARDMPLRQYDIPTPEDAVSRPTECGACGGDRLVNWGGGWLACSGCDWTWAPEDAQEDLAEYQAMVKALRPRRDRWLLVLLLVCVALAVAWLAWPVAPADPAALNWEAHTRPDGSVYGGAVLEPR